MEVNLLKRTVTEIKSLRNQNTIMQARLEVFDSMMAVFNNKPMKGWGNMESNDILKELELAIVEESIKIKDGDKPLNLVKDEADKF